MASHSSESTHRRVLLSRWAFRGAIILAFVVVGGGIFWYFSGGSDSTHITFDVRRGPLEIKVLEGGNVESLESQEIKSEVKGWEGVKILQIVEEGYYVTEEDVANKKKLVELDSSQLREKLTQAEITFKGTQASLTEAQQGYEIQINQSESDIYEAELAVTLGRLELEKYLGSSVTGEVLAKADAFASNWEEGRRAEQAATIERNELTAAAAAIATETDNGGDVTSTEPIGSSEATDGGNGEAPFPTMTDSDPIEISLDALRISHPDIDWASFVLAELLGDGEANQMLRKNEDELLLAKKELSTSLQRLDGTKKLFDKGFVTQIELETDQTAYDKQVIAVEAAETAKNVFVQYEFPKQSEKLLSDFVQAIRKLERTEKKALSEIAKARAALASAQARYRIEEDQIREYIDQIEKSSMFAKRPGLVVYGGGDDDRYWNEEQIKEGATVRERQTIITIPDTTSMAVKVKIHESEIKLVKRDQRVRVAIDAHLDKPLTGVVTQVAVLPDSNDRWMNPDLKVYETTIRIDGEHDWLRPGMSAETEILVEKLDDVLYIPIQSVVPDGKDQVCFVLEGGVPVKRVVTTGPVTVEYIVIESGLEVGERILIRPPDGSRRDEVDEEPFEAEAETESAPESAPAEPSAVVGQG